MVGRTLQRYRLVEEVGHGGMAVVYRGLDEGLEREVAVKLLHPHLAARVEHRRRLIREAKAVARLRHPNILEIFDFSGEDSPEAFLVTEFIRGTTLKSFALEHAFDPPEIAAACVYVLAGALAHAHEQGIVHRDLKPENVMIQRAGEKPVLKLMDFGIAQIVDRDERMTVTGALMGSPAHMAPEIIDGEEADQRSDLFSLGTILYWLITGQLPFDGPSPGALLKQVLSGEFTDPRVLRPAVSDQLAEVVARSLARNRAERYQSATEMQKALEETLTEAGIADPVELITQFLAAPDDASRQTRTTVVARLMDRGQAAAAKRKTGKALAAYSRVIAIVPGTPEAGAARQAIDRMNSRRRWRRRAAMAVGVVLFGGALAFAQPYLARWMTPLPTPPAPTPVAENLPRPPAPPTAVETPTTPTTPAVVVAMTPPTPGGTPRETALSHAAVPHVPPRPLPHAAPEKAPGVATTAAGTPPPLVSVMVVAKPWGEVFVDGEKKAPRTPYEDSLPAGKHVLQIRNPDGCCDPYETDLELVPGTPKKINARLEPLPARLVLMVNGPPDTEVDFDGQVKTVGELSGGKPLVVTIPPLNGIPQYKRTVRLHLHHDGFRELEHLVEVDAGKAQNVELTMVPQG